MLYFQKAADIHPIGRIGTSQDIIEAVMFLSDGNKAGWITGQVIRLDGGRSLKMSGFSTIERNEPKKKSKL